MAQGIHLDQTKFCCSICLELLSDPVTIACGHSYCLKCIEKHLDKVEDDRKKNIIIYSCPECRQVFDSRPVLVKNGMLAFVVEELKKAASLTSSPGPQSSPVESEQGISNHVEVSTKVSQDVSSYAGPGDVACDICTGGNKKQRKAVKSCVQCWVSYCEEHLRPHFEIPPLMKHKLVEVSSAKLQDHVCSLHQEIMKMFCRTDQKLICYLCSKDDHKGHEKVSAAAERAEKQKELTQTREKVRQRAAEKEKEVGLFQQEEEAVNKAADSALQENENIFQDLIRAVEKKLFDARLKIKARRKTEIGRFRKAKERTSEEIGELRRKEEDLEKLLNSEDHTHFLLEYPSLLSRVKNEPQAPPTVKVRRLRYFEKVTVALSEAKGTLQEALEEEYAKISMSLSEADVLAANPDAEPKTRADFLQYACEMTLAPHTANPHVLLCNDNRKAVFMKEEQAYSQDPKRFAYSWQVLSGESISGRGYFEVERSGRGVLIALAYGDIGRAGAFADCVFGRNHKSWALDCYRNSYEYRHNNVRTPIPGVWSGRVGVYVDFDAGVLSFYSISENMTLLHRVRTKFTRPLHAGLWLSDGATAEICKLSEVSKS